MHRVVAPSVSTGRELSTMREPSYRSRPCSHQQPSTHACSGHAVGKKTEPSAVDCSETWKLFSSTHLRPSSLILLGLVKFFLKHECVLTHARKRVSHLYRGCYMQHPNYHRCVTHITLKFFYQSQCLE